VKDFAQMMLTDHRTASQQLVDLASREGHPLPTVPAEGVQQRSFEMRRVSANEFDRTYMEQMVEDHIRTVNMFKEVAATSADPDVRAFAAAQVPTLEAHLRQAESLRDSLNKTAQR
jgi:putative membrane protein